MRNGSADYSQKISLVMLVSIILSASTVRSDLTHAAIQDRSLGDSLLARVATVQFALTLTHTAWNVINTTSAVTPTNSTTCTVVSYP